jgi:radical SAM protein with 4Fe4S-binding SPASM domain
VKLLADDIGADCTIAYPIRSRDDGSKDTHNLRILEDELYRLVSDNPSRFCRLHKRDIDAPLCHAGRAIASISSHGDVFPCVLFPLKVGSLLSDSFEDIWRNSPELNKFRNLKLRDTYNCGDCELLEYCPVCPGLSLLEEGDMLLPSNINCTMSKAIYHYFKQKGGENE